MERARASATPIVDRAPDHGELDGTGASTLHGTPGTPPLPGAALPPTRERVAGNGTMAVYEDGTEAAVPIELAVIDWMCAKLGYTEAAGGVLTSGGSLEISALLAMRQAHAGFDVWTDGAHGGPLLAVLTLGRALLGRSHDRDHGLGQGRDPAGARRHPAQAHGGRRACRGAPRGEAQGHP